MGGGVCLGSKLVLLCRPGGKQRKVIHRGRRDEEGVSHEY